VTHSLLLLQPEEAGRRSILTMADQLWQAFHPKLDVAKQLGCEILGPQLALAYELPLLRWRGWPACKLREFSDDCFTKLGRNNQGCENECPFLRHQSLSQGQNSQIFGWHGNCLFVSSFKVSLKRHA
jgi:hypothetical protein